MKIKELKESERPREKILEKGGKALDNPELLAILLRTGTGKRNVIETAQELLASAGNSLTTLSGFSADKMMEIPGIGRDKAATVSAAMELGKRFIAEEGPERSESITGAAQVYRIMRPLMKGLSHEECWVLFLNRGNRLIAKEQMSSGGMNATVLDIRMIMREALEKRAHGIIIVHNHPSGNPRPGTEDIRQTRMLKKAAETFDISLIDHVIISDQLYYSFADEQVETLHDS